MLSACCVTIVCDIDSLLLFIAFHFSHCLLMSLSSFVDCILSFVLDGMYIHCLPRLLLGFDVPELRVFRKQPLYLARGSGKVCVHSTLPRPHLVGFYWVVVVVVVVEQGKQFSFKNHPCGISKRKRKQRDYS